MNISAYKLAKETFLDQPRISEIIRGETIDKYRYHFAVFKVFWNFLRVLIRRAAAAGDSPQSPRQALPAA